MKRLFGTDGMRGEAGRFPLDAATIRTAGRSLARHLAERLGRAPRVVTGRDTRESGGWIEQAFLDGALAGGAAEAMSAGGITTPGVAYLARTLPADAGAVLSASHNPYHDNGIKIFAPTGRKLDVATERQIESDIYAGFTEGGAATGFDESAAVINQKRTEREGLRAAELRALYLDYLRGEAAAGLNVEELTIVVDCANRAASKLAPALLTLLGARVISTFDAPDGRNINRDCGSPPPKVAQKQGAAGGEHA